MASFISADGYPFDLGVENGAHKIISLQEFSSRTAPSDGDTLNTCQLWLSRGLLWYYAFNHEEAIQCFQKALEIGDNPVMAHYFISASNGPNYNTESMNKDAFPSATEAFKHARRAKELAEDPEFRRYLTDIEIDLVDALQCRFFDPALLRNEDGQPITVEPIEQDTDTFAEAMRIVYEKYPDDPNVAALYAEALMNKGPWRLWDLNTGQPTPHAVLAQRVIEQALVIAPNHPGLNHFFVHLMEMSPTPEASLPSCAVLRRYFPSAGHLIHMPSHIYVLLGMYKDAAEANIEAWEVDEVYVKKEGIYNYYTGYRIHNMHFISYAAMFAGRFNEAMRGAKAIQSTLPDSLLANPVMNRFFESFLSVELHVLLRFGRWEEILAKPLPADPVLHGYLTATTHYARGIAHAVLGETKLATIDLAHFLKSAARVPADHVLHNNLCSDMLAVGEHMLRGELLYRLGKYEDAFWELQMAADLSDNLVYDEPWGWMQPPVHALGALHLEQGRVAEAERFFRRDMDKSYYGRCHPDNIWALRGLEQCLVRRPESEGGQDGQARAAELLVVRAKLRELQARADSDVQVACMCATKRLKQLQQEKAQDGSQQDQDRA